MLSAETGVVAVAGATAGSGVATVRIAAMSVAVGEALREADFAAAVALRVAVVEDSTPAA